MNWVYGITTVPSRFDTLLPDTMRSLAAAGFDKPYLFIDGPADITLLEGLNFGGLLMRMPSGGHIVNWFGAITSLYTSCPHAERYALFEDDLLACPNLRAYLDGCDMPEKGYFNLLTHDVNLKFTNNYTPGWHESNQRGHGAVGLVFSRNAVIGLLNSPEFTKRAATAPLITNLQCADGFVIEALQPLGYKEYIHYPSLLQHVGFTSTIKNHLYGNVRGYIEGYDPLPLLKRKELESYT